MFGFNFTKISGEKKGAIKGKVNIANSVKITDLEQIEVAFGKTRQKALKFVFEYKSSYDPGVGQIVLEGELLDIDDDSVIKLVTEEWKKNKRIPEDMMAKVLNAVLERCNVQALIISRDLNLPPSVPLPKVKVKK